ncbi:MAG: hypothetical protein HY913_17800 [Desulfomonile tiedjei]|nr:hypothetical protein [Desulfomonile tiedjei]
MTARPGKLWVDYRLGGPPRYYLSSSEESFMKIPEEIRKCAAYIGYWDGQKHVLLGTCFWVGVPVSDLMAHIVYVVTAKHLIEKIREKTADDSAYLRVNFVKSGAQWIRNNLHDWRFHPTEDNVDAAVLSMQLTNEMDHRFFPQESFITDEIIETYNVGIGDEVFLAGLFGKHTGESRNIPIIRVGNIAAMPEEPVKTLKWTSEMEAYLIESRSLGGMSGSPVFVHLGITRTLQDRPHFINQPFYLLGLIHGHWDEKGVNVGIAIVVPSKKILEVINQPELQQMREVTKALARIQLGATPDSSTKESDEKPFTKQDFENALQKVSRPKSDEETT